MCMTVTERAGTITRLPSLLLYEESRFPLPSPGPRLQRDPGCHPGRGLTLSAHYPVHARGRDPAVPATVPGQGRDTLNETRRAGAALVRHLPRWGIFQTGAS